MIFVIFARSITNLRNYAIVKNIEGATVKNILYLKCEM